MPNIPRTSGPDASLSLLSEGYRFVSNRCRALGSDAFETRLMLERVVCMQGAEAARIFYEGRRFSRKDAMPRVTLHLLQDIGSVQQLEDEEHAHRKAMFMSLMTPEAMRALADTMERHWRDRLGRWQSTGEVVLLDQVQRVLCRTACEWAGVPLSEDEVERRTRELVAMIEAAGSLGPRGWHALLLRRRCERWARGILERVRAGTLQVPEGSAAHAIAFHREPHGRPLPLESAVVELLNILRPTVAVGLYVTFSAVALHSFPEWHERLVEDPERWAEPFVQEVRRFYPFFPFVGGRVRDPFDWHGYRFARGQWVVLDLYGTNHDPRTWPEPERFRPERFRGWAGDPFELVPQGAGDFMTGHRCPGEWATIALMKRALALLTGAMWYDVPEQSLAIDLSRMPAIPRSRLILRNVRAAA